MAQPFRVQAILDELSEDEIPHARIMGNLEKIDRYFASATGWRTFSTRSTPARPKATNGRRPRRRPSARNRRWPARSA